MKKRHAVQIDYDRFLDPRIISLEQVGSREVELEIEKLKADGLTLVEVAGYPVLVPPEHIIQAAKDAASSTFYPPSNGLLELREALARAIAEQYEITVDAESEILITSGGMHALHVVLTALLGPMDEALLISPCYFFGGLVEIARGHVAYAAMDEREGYALDFNKIREQITAQTKLIILNSPVNPTGYVYTREDVERFIALAEEFNLLLVSDESYDRMIYDGLQHFSPLSYPEGRRRTILVKSFTKAYALPTWRVGYVVADANLTRYFRKVLEWTVLNCPYINQRVALAAVEGPQDWLLSVFRAFENRRDQLAEGIRDIAMFSYVTPRGGPYLFLNVSGVTDDCGKFAGHLLRGYGIRAVSGKYFNDPLHVRIPFWGSRESVARLISALRDAGRLD